MTVIVTSFQILRKFVYFLQCFFFSFAATNKKCEFLTSFLQELCT